jgi:serine/threonine protein kinase
LGKGSYAVVHLATDNYSGRAFAVKVYAKDKMNTRVCAQILKNEIEVLSMCSHPNIVKYYGTLVKPSEVKLVLEYINGKSFNSYLKSQPGQRLPESTAKLILGPLLDALIYLHAQCIYHRDLKLDNILLNELLQPILIDFGFSCFNPTNQSLSLFCGTPNYMSPEIINKRGYMGGPSDAWSFGVLFYRVIVGHFPFASKTTAELNARVNSGHFFIPDTVSDDARRVIGSLLIHNADQRSTLANLKRFKFFIGH